MQINELTDKVCEILDQKKSQVRSPSRRRSLVWSRAIICVIAFREYGYTLKKIGEYFNGRDHSTICNAIRLHDTMILTRDRPYIIQYSKVIRELRHSRDNVGAVNALRSLAVDVLRSDFWDKVKLTNKERRLIYEDLCLKPG